MFRKLTLTGLTILGLALPLGLTPTANAHPPVVYQPPVLTYRPPVVYQAPVVTYRPVVYPHYHRSYEVLYRHGHHWHAYSTYRDRYDAERAARHLRWDGYDVRIEVRY